MLTQLIEDFLHVECGQDGLHQDRGAHTTARNTQRILGVIEHVVPQPRLQVALKLGQIEVGPAAAREGFLGIVEKEQSEIEQGPGNRLAVDQHVLLGQVPAARTHKQRRDLVIERVVLALRGDKLELAPDGIFQVYVAVHHVRPGRRQRVLEVRHEYLGPRVERIDHHAPVDRASNLAAAVLQIRRCRRHFPVSAAYIARLIGEVGHLAGVQRRLHLLAAFQQLEPGGVERSLQVGHEAQGIGCEHLLLILGGQLAGNLHPFDLVM